MGFRMSCDRCGRFMQNVKMTELKKIGNSEILCKPCVDMESKVRGQLERLKKQAEAEFAKTLKDYKTILTKMIQEIVVDGD